MRRSVARSLSILSLLVAGACTAGCGDGGPGGARRYEVTARVTNAVGRIGALQFRIVYEGASGQWVGRGTSVSCEVLTDGLAASNYPGDASVAIGIVTLNGFETPADIVKCVFASDDHPVPSDFDVVVTDASDVNTNPLPELPQMFVVRVMPLDGDLDEEIDDSPGDDEDAPAYAVTARVTNPVGLIGALQFDIRYTGESGGWAGRGSGVECEVLSDGQSAANNPGNGVVKIGLVDLQGIATPADVVRCNFRTYEELRLSDFEIEIVDASDVNTNPFPEPPPMAVTRIEPL